MSSKRSRDSISHSRLAPSLDNKVGLHNLLVFRYFRVAAAEHISQVIYLLIVISVLFHSLKLSIAFLRNLPESCVVLSFIVFAAKSLITLIVHGLWPLSAPSLNSFDLNPIRSFSHIKWGLLFPSPRTVQSRAKSKRKLGGRGIVSCYQGLLLCPVYNGSITSARRLCCSCMIATSPCDL
ncbi:hypothetical protein P8452_47045 [Trifolium repens]|nr:hypothetical protein P8452_04320 [Trifolium repens]WJX62001.1 hypothetical protein P8452_47045 [Trifolium repens]